MKKLLIVSNESVLAGCVKCGMAEVVDSLAVTMASHYEVSVICPDGNGLYIQTMSQRTPYSDGVMTCRVLNVTYYLVEQGRWKDCVIPLINELTPDIFHNFSSPILITRLATRPNKALFTFETLDLLKKQQEYLVLYDHVTTISETFAEAAIAELYGDASPYSLRRPPLKIEGLATGILTSVISPERGLFLTSKYDATNLSGRRLCQEKFRATYGIKCGTCIYVMMCRLIEEKGLDDVLHCVHHIRDTGGILVIVGRGDEKYEKQLEQLTRADGVIWIKKWASPMQAAPFMAGADFYLSPSKHESLGLMTMTAAQYGTIPIVTPINGMAENFDDKNAIVIGDDGLEAAINKAALLYRSKSALNKKRKICMTNDFGWDSRKYDYIEVYEG